MKKQFESLLDKEMDRKNFLKYTAAAGLMTLGGGIIVQSLMKQMRLTSSHQEKKRTISYGTSTYGGTPQTRSLSLK